ncbi:uncharacterized protein LOC111367376 isoform X1 [Olea europaea var. sylvestris]|uniref:uncharacterized protein LOC111367376 isoform X1 n=1 Tax=Olea europaea var. sylvestris TaxID=158386 RepID=UPI000C1D1C05|nr:uncharacterized protein LOC111367376 isoform X1 [Olea europaea var. sylvestris]
MLTSINTLSTALISNKLLRYPEVAIQVAVVSCLGEIFCITASDPPICDEIIQDIFLLFISSFAYLTSTFINLYFTAVRILDTMANAKYYLIMLDLDCERTIIDMFQHFLVALKENHLENVFTSIETIMTFTLEESDNIPLDLITLLLDSVQTKHKEVSTIAFCVVERLIEKCDDKIKPYFLQAIKSLGVCLDDYSAVLSSVFSEVDTCEQCIVSPILTTSIVDTLNSDLIEKVPKLMSSKSNISDVLDLVPTMLHDFNVDFVLVLPQLHEIRGVATLFSKVLTRLHTLPIDIRMLPANYRHNVLALHYFDNIPKFHVKLKGQIISDHEIFKFTFYVLYKLEYSYKGFLFDWPSNLNESYIFNIEELFPNQDIFEHSMLQSFVSTGQYQMLASCAPHYVQPREDSGNELHGYLLLGDQFHNLIKRRDRPPWSAHILEDKLLLSFISAVEFRYLVLQRNRPPYEFRH